MDHLCYYPHAFIKKQRGYCNRFRPSICPICYHLLNRWMKFNQICCVSYSHEWGVQRQICFGPAPWEGSKGQISFNFLLQSQFQRFLYQTLCLFPQKKDTKHIRRDFNSFALVMPQGSDFGALGLLRGIKKNLISNMVMLHIKSTG